ncbi:hypothetical protein CRUP_009425 [Coryphaenoides rupestris]|nr:hypothetical protein CRUP_009425 [Coryphaenoides rupestris]
MAALRFRSVSLMVNKTLKQSIRSLGHTPKVQMSRVAIPSFTDDNFQVEVGVTSDGNTIVCYHPSVDVPYELTQPIERPGPLSNVAESQEQVIKAQLNTEALRGQQGPTVEQLSKMFFTTKHPWYPIGQARMRRIKKNPPKDR